MKSYILAIVSCGLIFLDSLSANSVVRFSSNIGEIDMEVLDVFGSVWTWTKGTSALGGSSSNFTMTLTAPAGASLLAGADSLSGSLPGSNKPVWNQALPKGFSMKISPSTGLVSGKVPATQGGKSVLLPYQGVLFTDSPDIGSDSPVRGAGFVSGNGSSGTMEIIHNQK